jgi:biotin transport system substrate-specific component
MEMSSRTLVAYDLVRPNSLWLELPILIGFNIVLAACAYVSFPLAFSPVPITGQTFGVLLVAMALGRVRGTGIVLAYLIEGACGLPVVAGGSAGLHVLFGPTGGYLFGFLAAAYLVGWLAEKGWDRTLLRSVAAMTLGYAVIFAAGLAMLSYYIPASALLLTGFTPFLPGMILKIALAAWILPMIWQKSRRQS